MSAIAQDAKTAAEPFDKETPTEFVRYSFKTTEENKDEMAFIHVREEVKDNIWGLVMRSARWRSPSQFVTDALVFYLNDTDSMEQSVEEVIEETEWGGGNYLAGNITQTLFEEIDVLVNHGHTPWGTKQEFYICALQAYNQAGFPAVEQR